MGVPPWELENQPITWRNRALLAQSAENWVEAEHRRKNKH